MKGKRFYSLDVFKLFLAYVIAFFHAKMEFAPGPTVTVQIFFIISGFFLARKFYTRSYPDSSRYGAWDYTLDHVKAVYPHYFFSLAVLFLYETARNLLHLVLTRDLSFAGKIASDLYRQIPDLLLLQSSFRFHESMNYPVWQLSALLIAGYFIYALLCRNEKLCRTLIFPAGILMVLSILNTGIDLFDNFGPFYMPLLRAFAPMCVGVFTYLFSVTESYARLKEHRYIFDIAAILSLVSVLVYADRGNTFLLTMPILILNCCDEGSLVNRVFAHPIFRFCGDLSYAVFLNHTLIARILWALIVPNMEKAGLPFPTWQMAICYLILLTGYSAVTMLLVNRWKARRKAAVAA